VRVQQLYGHAEIVHDLVVDGLGLPLEVVAHDVEQLAVLLILLLAAVDQEFEHSAGLVHAVNS